MTCDQSRQIMLNLGWSADQRRSAADALQHVEQCADCQRALADYERLQDQLRPATQDASPVGGWDAFESRLMDAAQPRRSPWWPQAMKLAAAFLLGVALIEALRWRPAPPPNVAVAPPGPQPVVANMSAGAFTPQEIAQNAQAFDQVAQAFDRKTSWVLLANNTSDVGLSDQPIAPQHKLLLLRLTMTRSGETISSSDLMIIPGQSASLTVPLEQGQSLHYEIGTTTGSPMKLSLWAELQSPRGGQAIGALATQLQLHPNQKVAAGEMMTTSGAYQLKVGFSQATAGGAADGGKS